MMFVIRETGIKEVCSFKLQLDFRVALLSLLLQSFHKKSHDDRFAATSRPHTKVVRPTC
jgi:hypothetical protein